MKIQVPSRVSPGVKINAKSGKLSTRRKGLPWSCVCVRTEENPAFGGKSLAENCGIHVVICESAALGVSVRVLRRVRAVAASAAKPEV